MDTRQKIKEVLEQSLNGATIVGVLADKIAAALEEKRPEPLWKLPLKADSESVFDARNELVAETWHRQEHARAVAIVRAVNAHEKLVTLAKCIHKWAAHHGVPVRDAMSAFGIPSSTNFDANFANLANFAAEALRLAGEEIE